MCTSFVSYYGNPIYGMNFDFPEVDIKLQIEKSGDSKYICFYMNVYGKYYPFAGINLKGKFVNFQEMYVNDDIGDTKEPNGRKEIDAVDLFFGYLQDSIDIDQIMSIGSNTKLLYPENFKVHSLFADLKEKAVVLEYIKEQAVQSKINGKDIVMTNFSNFLNSNNESIDINCIGAERYLTAYRMVEEQKALLDIDKAINILSNTFQKEELYQTLCSLVFNPLENEIYMIVNRNTANVWKISLENEILENVNVQSNSNKIMIDNEGVIINQLDKEVVGMLSL